MPARLIQLKPGEGPASSLSRQSGDGLRGGDPQDAATKTEVVTEILAASRE